MIEYLVNRIHERDVEERSCLFHFSHQQTTVSLNASPSPPPIIEFKCHCA